MSRKQLIDRAKELYPTNLRMQSQWVKWTEYLYSEGKHVLLTGAFPHA